MCGGGHGGVTSVDLAAPPFELGAEAAEHATTGHPGEAG
jgi:hypothetical protein